MTLSGSLAMNEEDRINEMLETIDDFPLGTAVIVYRDGSGVVKDWAIGADPEMDDEKSLRAHLAKHLPAAEFIDFAIK